MISFGSGFKPSLKWLIYSLLRIDGKGTCYPIYFSFEHWNTYLPFVFLYVLISQRLVMDPAASSVCSVITLGYQSPGLDLEQ